MTKCATMAAPMPNGSATCRSTMRRGSLRHRQKLSPSTSACGQRGGWDGRGQIARDCRSHQGGRLQAQPGLAGRRSADLDAHTGRSTPVGALSDGIERHGNQFEEMLENSTEGPFVMAVALHTFICGQLFRMRPLRKALKHCAQPPHRDRVWYTRAVNIANYCFSLPSGVIVGS